MRIHRLELVAFGPFADRVSVDLDTLSGAGLFLLTGATGAGKTSVLDAVCFALYGAVPGDRQAAKRLRSDHAAPGVAPEVTLELTLAGRRFRITRSPAWQRPKKRGNGLTTEQARVLVEERVAGDWHALATRLDEAGHLVNGLLGMSLAQFCQVQLLPQGRFQAFLRADSAERHELLQKLFRTARFEAVEAWLRERRRCLRREAARHHDRVAQLVGRTSEVADTDLPGAWDVHALGPVAGEVPAWVSSLREDAHTASRDAEARAGTATEAEVAARREHEAATLLHERRSRLRRARQERAALESEREEHLARKSRLEAAGRAAAVLPVLDECDRATAERDTAAAAATAAVADAAHVLGVERVPEDDLDDHRRRAARAAADARALEPLVKERQGLLAELDEAEHARQQLEDELARVAERLRELPDTVDRARVREAEARRAAERLPDGRERAASAEAGLEAGRLAELLRRERHDAEARHREAVDTAQAAREHWLDVQEQRLTGMAAEIAGGLAVGACCPVCGSADHPDPARPVPGAPDATAQRAARRAVDDAEVERHARAEAVRDLDLRLERARERSGGRHVPELEREAAQAAAAVAGLQAVADELPAAAGAREEAEAAEAGAREQREQLRARLAALETGHDERRRRAAAIAAELDRALDEHDATSVSDLAAHLLDAERACARALSAVHDRDQAARRARAAEERAATALTAHEFTTAEGARGAALAPEPLAELTEQVHAHDVRLAAAESQLQDPDLLAADRAPDPDLARLAGALARAEQELIDARGAVARTAERTTRLDRLATALTGAVSAWQPVLAELELTDRLASLVDGTSPDNRLRMRLSGYVLAFRLRQVVAAANERLVGMTDGRYRLEHTGERGAGETRGGLSLQVHDDWTGEARDPVTLSGGETFVVSLALALGLADVITFEAGGAELDTLFVDEGFGSLDAETLDDVMNVLDTLREGGRVVGVVSHVAELRDRIPAQLHVHKLRTGSTIRHGGVG